MATAETSSPSTEVEIGGQNDLLGLQKDIEGLADISFVNQKELKESLLNLGFTNRVVSAIERYGYDGWGNAFLSSSHTDSIGVFTGQVVDFWGEHGASRRHLELSGRRSNGNIFDYQYTIRMGIGPHYTAGLGKHERDELDEHCSIQARYFKDGDVIDLSGDKQANDAFKLIRISLAELIATTHPIEIQRAKIDEAKEKAKAQISAVLGDYTLRITR